VQQQQGKAPTPASTAASQAGAAKTASGAGQLGAAVAAAAAAQAEAEAEASRAVAAAVAAAAEEARAGAGGSMQQDKELDPAAAAACPLPLPVSCGMPAVTRGLTGAPAAGMLSADMQASMALPAAGDKHSSTGMMAMPHSTMLPPWPVPQRSMLDEQPHSPDCFLKVEEFFSDAVPAPASPPALPAALPPAPAAAQQPPQQPQQQHAAQDGDAGKAAGKAAAVAAAAGVDRTSPPDTAAPADAVKAEPGGGERPRAAALPPAPAAAGVASPPAPATGGRRPADEALDDNWELPALVDDFQFDF
jgi:hypothetical protein